MKLIDLLKEAGFDLAGLQISPDLEVCGISSDSRTTKKGEVFVALRGLHYDGGCFIWEAFDRGAAFAVTERPFKGENVLIVDNARMALSRLWDAWYQHPAKGMKLIGITGTNGKTSTSFMLEWILKKAGFKTGLVGTVECRCDNETVHAEHSDALANMTTPDPAQLYWLLARMRQKGVQYVIMEVTSHALAFDKVAPLQFERALFSNLTTDHLDLHGDMEEYFLQKKKLFQRCEQAIISFSTPYGERLAEGLQCPYFEISPNTVSNFEKNGMEGVSFSLLFGKQKSIALHVPVPGEFSLENAALAAMTALSLGIEAAVVQKALSTFPGVRGRMERVGENTLGITAFLDYAHTPDALEKLLRSVRGFIGEEQRIVLLFGCGGDRDRGKRREMGHIASRLADFLILTSDNCRTERAEGILEGILRGVDKEKPHVVIKDRRAAIEYAVSHAKKGDVLLLVGKGHEEYEIQGEYRLPFSEREILKQALLSRMKEEQHEN